MPTLMDACVMEDTSHELCARHGACRAERMPWSVSQHALLYTYAPEPKTSNAIGCVGQKLPPNMGTTATGAT